MSVVFTDTFTVGADVDIASYPGTPDYSYLVGTAGDCTVIAANDWFEVGVTGSDRICRILNAACPTGDQEITADCKNWTSGINGYTAVRCHATTADCYVSQLDTGAANEVAIYRYTSGFTLLVDADRGIANSIATNSRRFKATGTNPVNLEVQIDATAVVTYDDSDAARKQSGRPGIGGYSNVTELAWVDNVSVDDLQGGGPSFVPDEDYQIFIPVRV